MYSRKGWGSQFIFKKLIDEEPLHHSYARESSRCKAAIRRKLCTLKHPFLLRYASISFLCISYYVRMLKDVECEATGMMQVHSSSPNLNLRGGSSSAAASLLRMGKGEGQRAGTCTLGRITPRSGMPDRGTNRCAEIC